MKVMKPAKSNPTRMMSKTGGHVFGADKPHPTPPAKHKGVGNPATEGRYDEAHHAEHHKVLLNHGFEYKGHQPAPDRDMLGEKPHETRGTHHYEHPKTGSTAEYQPRRKFTIFEHTAKHDPRYTNFSHHNTASSLDKAIREQHGDPK